LHILFFSSFAQSDRISNKRESRIGRIEVVRCETSYVKQEYRKTADTVFNQATKKDAYRVTAGKYTMSTTKKGKFIHQTKPYDVQLKKLWRIGRECGRLTVHYRMGHSLEAMGIQLRATDWTKIVSRKSSKERLSSASSVELQGSPQSTSPVAPQQQQPSESTDNQSSKDSTPPSPTHQNTPPPSILSVSPPPLFQPQTVFLAQSTAGGLLYFPSILMPVKSEPEDPPKADITSLQQCP
jgi:hypothetical protein